MSISDPTERGYTFLQTHLFGFSTGALHREFSTKQALAFLAQRGCRVVELGFVRRERLAEGQLASLTPLDLAPFSFVSLHAPAFAYGRNAQTEQILHAITTIHQLRALDLVVFHPDPIEDFSVLADLPFPVGIENMDNRKASFQQPAELEALLQSYPQFSAVLDLNHVYTIDPTMALAAEFYDRVGSKIVELQVSGYKLRHDPLVLTDQKIILNAVRDWNLPIIDEGLIEPKRVADEIFYVVDSHTKLGNDAVRVRS